MIISLTFTLLTYVFSLVFLKSVLDLDYLTLDAMAKVLIITLTLWFPFYLFSKLKKCCYPEAHEKLNE